MFLKDLKEFNLSKVEEKVLDFWKKNKIFEKSLDVDSRGDKKLRGGLRRKNSPYFAKAAKGKKHFTFFEGPPTANGRPGIHHVLARAFKDVMPRYKTMRGYLSPRRAGWDTHGLPVEIEVEKELGLKSKKDIEKYGIAAFNKKCRESVWKYKDEWERLTERMGFWLDLKNPYITYEKNYIETLWWIIKQIANRKLLYKGHRVAPWCPRCGTALSSHELALGYETVEDNSVYIKFKLKAKSEKLKVFNSIKGDIYILSWTTTPWTLPGNVALAVGEKIDYVLVEVDKDIFILAKERLESVGIQGKIIKEIKGKDLVGLEYEPLFPIPALRNKASHKIYLADFVTTTDGTGVVHTAVMYGEDDYNLGMKVGLPKHHTVDEQGKFKSEVKGLAGLFVKSKQTEDKIFAYLEKNKNLLKIEKYSHEYPFCWRCKTPLLYYARESWFVAMSKLKKQLLESNNKINWIPEHMKNGRFGEWLKDAKDWNFSRERYWGTPLPIWECKKCGEREVIGSLEELDKKAGETKNKYWVMRHGESEIQLLKIIDSGEGKYHLTDKGKDQVKKAALDLRKNEIDLIFHSPVLRARETAQIVAKVLGKKVVADKRIAEINLPTFSGKPSKDFWKIFPTYQERFEKNPERGESLRVLRERVWNFIKDLERRFKNKRILLVTHGDPAFMLSQIANGWPEKDLHETAENYFKVGEVKEVVFRQIPRDETGEVNLHRPYVDEIHLKCGKCKGEMRRIKELCDVWFDSGAMPFAQGHFPFALAKSKEQIASRKLQDSNSPLAIRDLLYSADYICEAVDQTRGWFYTMLAVSVALGYEAPYKNVISLGHILDKNGQKMSKSKGNVVDPWVMAEKYGMDAVRWYFYTATPPGEPRNFDEAEILKTYRRFHLILWNSFLFYQTYADKRGSFRNVEADRRGKIQLGSVLDEWIVARLDETIQKTTKAMDKYDIRAAALEIEKLGDDLSRWYIRRSRRRLQKPENKKDYEDCSRTLGFVLLQISKLMAPFNPFFSELLYEQLRGEARNLESVHLEEWPKSQIANRSAGGQSSLGRKSQIIKQMEEVRRLAALGLAKRAEAGIKVRQPLATLRVAANRSAGGRSSSGGKSQIANNRQLLDILAEEVNVKRVVADNKISGEVELDTNITSELKEEGIVREFIRAIQELRGKASLSSNDAIVVMLELLEGLKTIIQKNESWFKKEVGAKRVEYKKSAKFLAEIETKIDGEGVWIGIKRL